jgi:hypothetical protein
VEITVDRDAGAYRRVPAWRDKAIKGAVSGASRR